MSRTPRLDRYAGDGRYLLPVLLLLCAPGCMSQQLGFSARRTVNTWPDLHYQQVVDNLAKIAANPGFLPHLAVAGQGSVQVTDNGSSLLALKVPSNVFAPGGVSFGASRNVTGTWSLGTVTSPDKIRSMQAVYKRALHGRAAGDPAFGWLKIGGRGDVPRRVIYEGHFEDVYVWIEPEGAEGLSDLTLAIMEIATSEEVGDVSVANAGISRGLAGPPGVRRRNFQVPPAGPVFTPGSH
jgi:hypothetical protein